MSMSAGRGGTRTKGRRDRVQLVGREIELAALDQALGDVCLGHPRFLFFSGPPGIGKTSLVRTLAEKSKADNLTIGIGRAHDHIHVPYLPLINALSGAGLPHRDTLDELIALLTGGMGAEEVSDDGGVVAHSGPETKPGPTSPTVTVTEAAERGGAVSHSVHDTQWNETLDASRGAIGLYQKAVQLLLRCVRDTPLVLLVEDIHWADPATLELLGYLTASLSDLAMTQAIPVLIAVSHRTDLTEAAERFVARTIRLPETERLHLEPLTERQTRAMIVNRGYSRPAQTLVTLVHETAMGNPLFTETVLGELEQQGALQEIGGHTVAQTSGEALRMPFDIGEAIARRISPLSDDESRIFTSAALMGSSVSLEDLARVSGTSRPDLQDLFAGSNLVEETGPDVYRFSHPLIIQALTSSAASHERRRIHLQIADHLEHAESARHKPDASDLWQIAHHLIQAGSEADPARREQQCRRAALAAARVFAWGTAAAAWIGVANAVRATQERADCHLEAALCYHNAWDWGPCVEQFDLALDLFRSVEDDVGVARVLAARARSRLPARVLGEQLDTAPLTEAIASLGENSPGLKGLLHSRLADAHWNARAWSDAQNSAQEALRVAEEIGDDKLASVACVPLSLAEYELAEFAKAKATLHKSLYHAARTDAPWLTNVPRQRLVQLHIMTGTLDDARQEHEPGLALCQKTGDLGETSYALSNGTALAAIAGEHDRVESGARETLDAVELSRYPFSGYFAAQALSYSRMLRGHWREAGDAISLIAQPGVIFDEPGEAILGHALAVQDYIDTCADQSASGESLQQRRTRLLQFSHGVAQLGQNITGMGFASVLFDHALEAQVHEAVELLLPAFEDADQKGLMFAPGWPSLLRRLVGEGYALLGQHDMARQQLLEAEAKAAAADARVELARVQFARARVLAAGSQNDQSESLRLLDRAHKSFAELAMGPSRDRSEALAAGLGLRLAPILTSELADPVDRTILKGLSAHRSPASLQNDLLLTRSSMDRRLARLATRLDTDSQAETIAEAIDRRLVPVEEPPRVPMTILVTDMLDYTGKLDRLGDARAQRVVQAHDSLLRQLVRRHSGREVSYTGDGFIFAFQSAPEAIACAIDFQRSLQAFNDRPEEERVSVRIGLDAGEPLLDPERLFGRALVSAVRICSLAEGGEVFISQAVRDLLPGRAHATQPLGAHELKGFRDPVNLHRVLMDETVD